jgi:archaellum component FlaC
MRGRRVPIIFGASGIILAIVCWLVMQAFRSALIVRLGIIGANNLRLLSTLALAAVGLILVFIGLPGAIKDIKNKSARNRLSSIGSEYRSKDSGPDEVREQLGLLRGQRTELAGEIDRCISQLDEIDEQLGRFDRLIKINEADKLADAREALEETERTVCSNLKWIINSSVAASEHDQTAKARLGENIGEVLAVNEKLLDKDDEFLLDLADHLSRVKGEDQAFELDAWRETISSLNQESLKGE